MGINGFLVTETIVYPIFINAFVRIRIKLDWPSVVSICIRCVSSSLGVP